MSTKREPLTGEQRLSLCATTVRWERDHRQSDARKLADAFGALLAERDRLTDALTAVDQDAAEARIERDEVKAKLQHNPGGYYWWIQVKDAHGDCPFGREQCQLCDVLYGSEAP